MEMNMNTNTNMQNSVVAGNTYHGAGKETKTSTFTLEFQKMESENDLSETSVETSVETSSVSTVSEKIYEQMSSTLRRDLIKENDRVTGNIGTAAKSDATESAAADSTAAKSSVADSKAADTDSTDPMQMIRDKMAEMHEKIKNGDIEEKIQIGGATFSIGGWKKMLDKFDSAQDAIKDAIKEEVEEKIKAANKEKAEATAEAKSNTKTGAKAEIVPEVNPALKIDPTKQKTVINDKEQPTVVI